MNAFTVAAAIAALDGADWLPPTTHWEIAATDDVWGAHCEIAADNVSEAYRLLCSIASAHDAEVGDDSRLLTVDFTYDEVPVRAWWLRPVKRWDVPEQCATCPTRLGEPDVSFVRLGVGAEAPVICVPCRDQMHKRWVNDEAGKVSPAGAEITQPVGGPLKVYRARRVVGDRGATLGHYRTREKARERCITELRARGPQLVPDVIFGWIGQDHIEVLNISTPAEPRPDVTDYVVTEITVEGDEPAQPAELTIYRASHDSIVMGRYTNRDAARKHCETVLRREVGPDVFLGWVPDDGSEHAAEELCIGHDVECSGYVVTPLTVASAYDEEADE